MQHPLPELPYPEDALEPHISAKTLLYHYGKHHAGYVKKLNGLIEGTDFEDASLEDIIATANGALFNNAAQVWNHNFYWRCLNPEGGGQPEGALLDALNDAFESLSEFKQQFMAAATGNFDSGWTWLVKAAESKLEIVNTDDADTPLTAGKQPLLVCDVWEHAYYIDYRNDRAEYVSAFWQIINWSFVADNFVAG